MATNAREVKSLLPDQYDRWNHFADASPQGDVFCYSWWLDAITKGNFKILAIFENDEIVAGIPLAYYLGKINEPPLTRTLGPLYKKLAHLSEYDQITRQRKWLNLLLDQIPLDEVEQFCTSHNFTDWLPFRWRGLKQMTRYTYIIDYTNKQEHDLWASLNRNRKRVILTAQRNCIRTITTHSLQQFYELVKLTYEIQNLKFRLSFEDLKLLDDQIAKRHRRIIITAFDENGQPHAAIYSVFNHKSAYALMSAGDPQLKPLGGHTLAMWESIKYFRDKVSYFNFGGSDIERIENHLRGFGGKLTPYFHIFTEKPLIREVKRIKEIEVVKEVPVLPPQPPDDWKYHVKLLYRHSWILIKKTLYKIHIRFREPLSISVVTACYNHGKYIHEMLASVLHQTYQNFELIIVNDGSTDDTANILNRIRHKKIKIIHAENHGPAHARNLAIRHARGELIVNLDADDKIAPDFLQKCVQIMNTRPSTGIVYGNVELFGYKNEPFVLPDYSFENMLHANCIVANACFRKSDWAQTEGYSPAMKYGYEDFDFWLSILELGRDVHQIKEPLVFYRTYENQKESRSGRRKQNPAQMEEVIVQAFQRHKNLYQKVPHIYDLFSEMEKQFILKKQQQLNDPEHPVFSIITPTNKRPQLLKRAVESVISQSFSNWELIIVDDANNPETAGIVAGFNDPRILYLVNQNPKGAAGARNTGIKYARGLYINFLDDDDEYLPGILHEIYNSFEEATNNPGFIWTGITRVRDTANGEETIRTQVWPADFNSREEGLMVSTAIGNGFGLSVKKECVDAVGLYDENLVVGEDTEFMMRLSQKFNFRTVPEVLVKIHHHGETQLTHEKHTRLKWENYGKIIDRHFDFLSRHWDALYMHNMVYVGLCYQLKKNKAGRNALLKLIRQFPNRRILWLELLSFDIYGKNYTESKLKKYVEIFKHPKRWREAYKYKKWRARSIKKMDRFREDYDQMTFDQLVKIADKWLHLYPEQASYTLPYVQNWIQNFVPDPAFIIEIGGWRGDLADAILNESDKIKCWDNYDVISDQSTQKCKHPLYRQIPLSDYIWNLDLDKKYNALIATHVIEHLKWREVLLLIRWIPDHIETVLFEAPIVESAENYNWKGHHSTHILEKGWKQVIDEMSQRNFKKVFSEKDSVIYRRERPGKSL